MKHAFTKRKLRRNELEYISETKTNLIQRIKSMVQTKYANFMSMITGPDVKSAYEKITHRSIISKHKLISDTSQKY